MAKYTVQAIEIEEIYTPDHKMITDVESLRALDCRHGYLFEVEAKSKEDAINKVKATYQLHNDFIRDVEFDAIEM